MKIEHVVDKKHCGDFIADKTFQKSGWFGNTLFLICSGCGTKINLWCPGGDTDVSKTDWRVK